MAHDLASLIVGGFTLAQAERGLHNGTIPQPVYDRFTFLWCWSAARSGDWAGVRHDRAYAALGRDLYWRRIDRVRAWCDRIKARASSWGGDPARGAALGRADHLDGWRGRKWSIRRVRINRGGYDDSGAYWGIGAPLFRCATDDDKPGLCLVHIRAKDRSAARAEIARDYPGARFFR